MPKLRAKLLQMLHQKQGRLLFSAMSNAKPAVSDRQHLFARTPLCSITSELECDRIDLQIDLQIDNTCLSAHLCVRPQASSNVIESTFRSTFRSTTHL